MILQENTRLTGLEAHLLFPTFPMGLMRWEGITPYKYMLFYDIHINIHF